LSEILNIPYTYRLAHHTFNLSDKDFEKIYDSEANLWALPDDEE
jgi:hypothetical protein